MEEKNVKSLEKESTMYNLKKYIKVEIFPIILTWIIACLVFIVLFKSLHIIQEHGTLATDSVNSLLYLLLVALFSLIFVFCTVLMYIKTNRHILNGICTNVLYYYQEKEQERRFHAVKKCIMEHKGIDGNVNIKNNVAVIEAAIAYDKTLEALPSVLFGAIGILSLDELIKQTENTLLIVFVVVALLLMFQFHITVARTAFIKRVLESIKEDIANF